MRCHVNKRNYIDVIHRSVLSAFFLFNFEPEPASIMAKRSKKSKTGRRHSFLSRCLAIVVMLVLAPPFLLNGAVSVIGRTPIFPLSFNNLEDKFEAVKLFFFHLPGCIIHGHPGQLDGLIRQAEQQNNLPEGLLAALIHVESGGKIHRISRTGAMGPGQLMPATARLLKVRDPYDPAEAIDGSARYLARQIARFKDIQLALAAYNAGPGNVRNKVPVNGETERYVPRVLAEYQRRQALQPKPPEASRSPADPKAMDQPNKQSAK
jgi:Soluble lytic murein transglycosylase and related regulatory proteins (some contain LysM/invasin domains)